MHELSIACELVEQVEAIRRAQNARAVSRIAVSIGELCGVDREAFEFAWPAAVAGTPIENAALAIADVPAEVYCRQCRRPCAPARPLLLCGACGGDDIEVVKGRDFILDSVELNVDTSEDAIRPGGRHV